MSGPTVFDASYREELPLPDGGRMCLRLVRPADREGILAAFEQLSAESRFDRWFYSKSQLTEQDLAEILATDERHLAIAALELDPDGSEAGGVGMGRFAVNPDDPQSAEFAITVVDPWQGLGVGRILLHRVLAAMGERGIRYAEGRIHVDNRRIRRLLEPYVPPGAFTRDGTLLSVRFPVPAPDDPLMVQLAGNAAAVVKLFRRLATGALVLPLELVERRLRALGPRAKLEELRRRDRGPS